MAAYKMAAVKVTPPNDFPLGLIRSHMVVIDLFLMLCDLQRVVRALCPTLYMLHLYILAGKCEHKRFLGRSSGRWKDYNNKRDPILWIGGRHRPVVGSCEHYWIVVVNREQGNVLSSYWRRAGPFVYCGQLWQNLVFMRKTCNSIHRMKNEYVCL